MKKLSKTAVNRLIYNPNGPSKQTVFDGRLPGFGVRVYPSGRKSYVLQYGPAKARRLMVLGKCTTGADVDEMREYAQALLRDYERDGQDPLTEQRRRSVETVGVVVSAYIDAKETVWAPREGKRARSRLTRHIGAKLAKKPLSELTRADVRTMHRRISRTTIYEANRTVQLLRAAINWIVSERDWPTSDLKGGANPAAGVKLNHEKVRREWIRPAEIRAVLKAIDAEENPWQRAFFQMALLTGARKDELLKLRWRDVDLTHKTALFRDTKNKTDHEMPLSAAAIAVLEATPRMKENPFVFCGRKRGQALVNPYKAKARIFARAGIDRRVTIHDIRRTAGSLLASNNYSTQQIGKLLGHKSTITAKVYAEIAGEAKQEMAEALAGLVA